MRNLFLTSLLTLLCLTIPACQLSVNTPAEENLLIYLPEWPPVADGTETSPAYPPLSRWLIQITGAEFQNRYYTTGASVSVNIKKNRPFCITAQPITILQDGSETLYFKPAGYFYPASEQNNITWEQGYLAQIMQKMFLNCIEEYMPPVDIEYHVSTFNWKKAQETIQKKLDSSSTLFYNPWLISESKLLQSITSHSFKATLLNATGCAALPVTTLTQSSAEPAFFLSSFIPENFSLNQKNQFTVMKNSPIIIGDGSKYGYFVTYKTTKNISLEFIYLPIYIEDI